MSSGLAVAPGREQLRARPPPVRGCVDRRARLGGLLDYYRRAA